jgi:Leucine-rich repeat (LRR) protein
VCRRGFMVLLVSLLFLLSLLSHPQCGQSLVSKQEIFTLQELYLHTNGEDWRWLDETIAGPKWNFNQTIVNPCCEYGRAWQGIECSLPALQCCTSNTCQIRAIQLNGYRMRGDIDISWQNLKNLTILSLVGNHLTGHFPYNVTFLTSLLELDFSVSLLSGPLPSALGSFHSLLNLDLSYCNFTGPIPTEIGELTTLETLRFPANSLTSFPSELGQLHRLTRLEGFLNYFNGPLPSSIGQLTKLDYLSLYASGFTGELPSSIGSLIYLTSLSIDTNKFEGSLLPLASLTNLRYLACQKNRFTGNIPTEFGSLVKLTSLYMYQNLLTGSIPSQLGSLTLLQYWYCYGNGLYGPIPSFLGTLPLKGLDFALNYFTETIPLTLQSLSELAYLNFNRNYLHGPIPSELGSLISLDDLQMTVNYLSSSIPSSLSLLTKLTMLSLHDNSLTGELPIGFGNLTSLGQLYLQGNRLTGHLHSVFSSSQRMQLTHLDLSDNLFSGQIPDSIFQPSLLSTLALTSNCFQGNIPSSICNAKKLSILSMDGLSAAKDCIHKRTVPITNIPLGNSLSGDIPHCIWSLSNLTVLSLTANGLSGSLPSTQVQPSLVNLSLSHNHLTGTIPKTFQEKPFIHLDLSYNKFHGEFSELGSSSLDSETKRILSLEINRLSGKLPALPSRYSSLLHLNILTGNVFSCENLPTFDVHEDTYECGSSSLDNSLYSIFIILLLSILGIGCYSRFSRSLDSSQFPQWHEVKILLTALSKDEFQSQFPNFYSFHKSILCIGLIIIGICTVSILLLLPLYIFRQVATDATSSHSTHSHLYRWTWSTAYLTGIFPSMYILCVWFVIATMSIFGSWLVFTQQRKVIRPITAQGKISPRNLLLALLFVIVNISIVGAINGLYIFSTFRKQSPVLHYTIQLSLAFFKWFWSVVFVPTIILSPLSNSITLKSFIRILLFLLNNVIIPSIAAMLTSPSCYRGLLVEPDEIVSSYTYQICSITAIIIVDGEEITTCVSETDRYVEVAPLTPPFSYGYQCASTVLTAYIPVYLYIYCLEILMPFVTLFLLLSIFPSYSTVPKFLIGKVPSIFWKDFPEWIHLQMKQRRSAISSSPLTLSAAEKLDNSETTLSSFLDPFMLRPEAVYIPLMQHLAIILTFGMNSPVLALAIALATTSLILQYHLVTSRFIHYLNQSSAKDEMSRFLSQTFVDPSANLLLLCWLIVLISCVCISALCWDIAGDQVGWKSSYWVPILGSSCCVLLYIIFTLNKYFHPPWPHQRSSESVLTPDPSCEISMQHSALVFEAVNDPRNI